MIIDYGPLPGAAIGSAMDWLIPIGIFALAIAVGGSWLMDTDPPLPFVIVWTAAVAVLILTIVAVFVVGVEHGRQSDTIRDEHYPILLEQAGYTDLQKIYNDEYAVQTEDGDLAVVQITAVEGFDTKFMIIETE